MQVHLRIDTHLGHDLEAELGADAGHGLGELLDTPGSGPDVVEVFAVAAGGVNVQLVEAGATPEDQLVAQVGVIGDSQMSLLSNRSCSTWVRVGHGAPAAQWVTAASGITGRVPLRC